MMDWCKLELSELKSPVDIVKLKETKLRRNSVINLTCLWVLPPFKDEIRSSDFTTNEGRGFKWNFTLNRANIERSDDTVSSMNDESEKELESILILRLNFYFRVRECIWQAHILNDTNLKTDDFQFKDTLQIAIRKSTGGFSHPSQPEPVSVYFQKMKYQRSFIENGSKILLGNSKCIKIISYISIKVNNNFENPMPLNDIIRNTSYNNVVEELNFLRNHNNDIKNLLNNKNYSDCLFKIEEKNIYVHKSILAAKSKVFDNMFLEKLSKYEINNISYDNLMIILNFIYSGEVENFNFEKALKLLVESDKYKIDDLKLKCEKIISKNINLDNAIDNLILSDDYSAKLLKDSAISFIVKNIKKYQTNEFQRLANKNPNLLVEILGKHSSN